MAALEEALLFRSSETESLKPFDGRGMNWTYHKILNISVNIAARQQWNIHVAQRTSLIDDFGGNIPLMSSVSFLLAVLQVKYKKDFEESKGRGFSIVSDTPEMQRDRKSVV